MDRVGKRNRYKIPQDLHIHTTYSFDDSAVSGRQTIELIAFIDHAEIIGISDHFENFGEQFFDEYAAKVKAHNLKLGLEVSGGEWAQKATKYEVDYYVYHCSNQKIDYRGAELLLNTGKPVIIAHPIMIGTDPTRLPEGCVVEINNRYIWRNNWRRELKGYLDRFEFVISSDAHQPHWLNQTVARRVAEEMGIKEKLLF